VVVAAIGRRFDNNSDNSFGLSALLINRNGLALILGPRAGHRAPLRLDA
jgi:hypothetical protein